MQPRKINPKQALIDKARLMLTQIDLELQEAEPNPAYLKTYAEIVVSTMKAAFIAESE